MDIIDLHEYHSNNIYGISHSPVTVEQLYGCMIWSLYDFASNSPLGLLLKQTMEAHRSIWNLHLLGSLPTKITEPFM